MTIRHRLVVLTAQIAAAGSALLGPGNAEADIYACAGDSIRVFAQTATPDSPPIRVIAGAASGVSECYGIALDTLHGELWVAHGVVSVFRADASGNVAPLRRIGTVSGGVGSANAFASSVAVDVAGDEVVVGTVGGMIMTFPRTGQGNIAATRTMQVGSYIDVPVAMVVDRIHDEILAIGYQGSSSIYAFPRLQDGPAAPLRTPLATGLVNLRGLVLDRDGDYIHVAGQSGMAMFGRDGSFFGHTGNQTLTSPWGLVLADDAILVANQSNAPDNPNPIYFYTHSPPGGSPIRLIRSAAPANRAVFGITTSAAKHCSAGHVIDDCLFRSGFQGGSG